MKIKSSNVKVFKRTINSTNKNKNVINQIFTETYELSWNTNICNRYFCESKMYKKKKNTVFAEHSVYSCTRDIFDQKRFQPAYVAAAIECKTA